jgi:hypothetical protein
MAGSMQKNGANTAYSLANWQQLTQPKEIKLNEQFSVLVKPLDVMAFMTSGADNPLMGYMQGLMKGGKVKPQDAEKNLLDDPKAVAALIESLDKLLIEAVVEPPLLEQGNDEGIPVGAIPFAFKLAIFNELIGGLAVQQVQAFPEQQIGGLEVGQDSDQVWEDAE